MGSARVFFLLCDPGAYLRISLSLIMRFTSSTIASLTHTITISARVRFYLVCMLLLTFFADEGIIAVIRVVRISYGGTATFANGAEIKLCVQVSDCVEESVYDRHVGLPRNSCPNRPE